MRLYTRLIKKPCSMRLYFLFCLLLQAALASRACQTVREGCGYTDRLSHHSTTIKAEQANGPCLTRSCATLLTGMCCVAKEAG